MKFQFNVNLTDEDYLEYNKFWAIKSHYGKKQMLAFRVVIGLIVVASALITLYGGGFTLDSFISAIPMLILLLLFEIFLSPLFVMILKHHLKGLKKKGKMGYSPSSVIEFYEENIVESTPEQRTEQNYSCVERISIVDNKTIYIHLNNVAAYILPTACFESKEQYDGFLEFIKTKCDNIDIY